MSLLTFFDFENTKPINWADIGPLNKILEPTSESPYCLYLGGVKATDMENICQYNIKSVLSLVTNFQLGFTSELILEHKKITIDDYEMCDLKQYFEECIEFIDQQLKHGNVLVHCMAGVSRSASIVIVYIMKKYKLSYNDAYLKVQNQRIQILPNKGFIRQMKQYEVDLQQLGILNNQ